MPDPEGMLVKRSPAPWRDHPDGWRDASPKGDILAYVEEQTAIIHTQALVIWGMSAQHTPRTLPPKIW
jgi:hypothetical protein